jgi:hypothetical protein
MTPERREALSWTPENPLAIGFTVIDDMPFGGHPLTAVFQERLDWFRHRQRLPEALAGLRLFVTLVEAPRAAERSQWRLHLATQPSFQALSPIDRAAVAAYARDLAVLVVAWQEVEDVDATLPA